MEPPVPIPNTVVKHLEAESTCMETCWEDRKLPVRAFRLIIMEYGGYGEAVNTADCGSVIAWVRSPLVAPLPYRGIAQLVE